MTSASKRKAQKPMRGSLPRDVVSSWNTWAARVAGEDQPGINCYALELPLNLLNWTSTFTPPEKDLRRIRVSHATARFTLPVSTTITDSNQFNEIFIGWNKTPTDLSQHTVLTHKGYDEFRARCDIIKVSGTGRAVSVVVPDSPWRQFLNNARYLKYKDWLDEECLRYTHGSIIVGFVGYNSSLKATEIADSIRVELQQQIQFSRND